MDASRTPMRWIGDIERGYLEITDRQESPDRQAWLVANRAEMVIEAVEQGHLRREAWVEVAVRFAAAMGVREAQRGEVGGEPVEHLEGLLDRLTELEGEVASVREELEAVIEAGGASEETVDRLFAEAAGRLEQLSG